MDCARGLSIKRGNCVDIFGQDNLFFSHSASLHPGVPEKSTAPGSEMAALRPLLLPLHRSMTYIYIYIYIYIGW